MKKSLLLAIIFYAGLNFVVVAQNNIDGKKAWDHVNYLSSNEFKGRKSGRPEYQKAAEYVAEKMKEYGLEPGGDNNSYFQEVPFRNWNDWVQPISLTITEPQFRTYYAGYNRDFQPVRNTGSGKVKAKLAFVGYGIEAEQHGWNDYEHIKVDGRIVIINPALPNSLDKNIAGKWNADKKIKKAIEKGAVGVIMMNPGTSTGRRGGIRISKETCPEGFVVITANSTFLTDVFYIADKSMGYIISKTIRENKSYTELFDITAEIEAHYVEGERTAPNVIGIIPGTDKKLKKECIVIGGHLDHLGVNVNGFVYNGADDNCVSTGALLELARVFQLENFKPKRTIIFTNWAGEEIGLVGSRYYANNPVFPLEKTCLYINLDMAGAGDKDLVVGGMYNFKEIFDIIKETMDEDMKNHLVYRLNYGGSDHSAFLGKGVKAISLRTGNVLTGNPDDEHPEYHKPGDMAEYVDPEVLAWVVKYHYDMLHNLANTDIDLLDPVFDTKYLHRNATITDMYAFNMEKSFRVNAKDLKKEVIDLILYPLKAESPSDQYRAWQVANNVYNKLIEIGEYANQHSDKFVIIKSPNEIRSLKSSNKPGIILGLDGGYALEEDILILDALYRSGVRFMTLKGLPETSWLSEGSGKKLSDLGKKFVQKMNNAGIMIDMAELDENIYDEVLQLSEKPVIVSHACCKAISDHPMNLSDNTIKKITENNGVIGISFSNELLSSRKPSRPDYTTVVDHIDHIVKITESANHVGLGFGNQTVQYRAKGLKNNSEIFNITKELKKRGYSDRDIRRILGDNFLRVFRSQN